MEAVVPGATRQQGPLVPDDWQVPARIGPGYLAGSPPDLGFGLGDGIEAVPPHPGRSLSPPNLQEGDPSVKAFSKDLPDLPLIDLDSEFSAPALFWNDLWLMDLATPGMMHPDASQMRSDPFGLASLPGGTLHP